MRLRALPADRDAAARDVLLAPVGREAAPALLDALPPEEADESDGCAPAMHGTLAIAVPIPSATASAPRRPIFVVWLIDMSPTHESRGIAVDSY